MSLLSAKIDLNVTPTQNAISGAISGVMARFATAPLDVIKIRLQLQTTTTKVFEKGHSNYHKPKYQSIFQAGRLIIKEEGILGLWKGNLSALYLYLAYGAVQFAIFHEILNNSKKQDSFLATHIPQQAHTFIAGAISGCVSTVSTYPLDLLRTRFAVQRNNFYPSLTKAIKNIFVKEGISGFYRGMLPTLVQIIPQMGLIFESHRIFVKLFKHLETKAPTVYKWTSGYSEIFCGAMAGVVTKVVVMSFDVIRKRYQVQGPMRNAIVVDNVPRYHRGIVHTACQIVKHEGVLALYKGIVPCLAKAAPGSAVTFFVVNECRLAFSQYNEMQQSKS
ncbi:mitochondrial thiamine pyrophosphate transporter [Batrachochytrium dendrobatidis]|nr:mitochondrial thiamine pyrophosphate transporter [Batrachochytrium dendrobatidis]